MPSFTEEDLPDAENKKSMAQNFAAALGSMLGAGPSPSSAPVPEEQPAAMPAPAPAPASSQYSKPLPMPKTQQPPQDSGGGSLSDQMKMALIPLGTLLAGGLLGGNQGAMIGAQSGLQGVGNELQKQETRDAARQALKYKEQEQKNLIAETYRQKGILDDKTGGQKEDLLRLKDELRNGDQKSGEYLDDKGNTRVGPIDTKTGEAIDNNSGRIKLAARASPEDKASAKETADAKKSDLKVGHQFANDMNPRKGRSGQFGALAKRNDAADAVLKVLVNDDGTPADLTKGNRTEAAIAVANLISQGGAAAQHTVEQMTPSSLKGDYQDKVNYLFNTADPAEMKDAVQRLIDTANREKGVIGSQIRDAQIQVISDPSVHEWRQRHPEDWTRTLKAAHLNPDDFGDDSLPVETPSWNGGKAKPGPASSATAPDLPKLTRQQKIDAIKAARGQK